MRLYITLFFCAMLMLAACSDTNSVPDDVIPKQRMTSLLTDVHIVDGGLSTVGYIPDTMYKYGTARYLELFKKYHTDSTQFRKSLKFYSTRPEMLSAMYDEIIKNLNAKNDSVAKLKPDVLSR